MKSEDIELFKDNPWLILFILALVVLVYFYQKQKLKRSKKDKNKIVGFDKTGLIPVRESFYDFWNLRHVFQIALLGLLLFFGPLAYGVILWSKNEINGINDMKVLVAIFLWPLVFVGILYQGWIYKKAKEKKLDITDTSLYGGLILWEHDVLGFSISKWVKYFIIVFTLIYVLWKFFSGKISFSS